VGKIQLGTVRLRQRRYPEALAAYVEARERFTQLDEPGNVAASLHQTGMVYEMAGQPEAAEDAYRKSLAINVRLANIGGQARTLLQLGNLYANVLHRQEDAVAFHRRAADKFAEIGDAAMEGAARNNLATDLYALRRHDDARREIRRAIACKSPFGHASEPWRTWDILADIETDSGNLAAATAARANAVASYLAYRRDGGENHDASGRVVFNMHEKLRAAGPGAASSFIQQLAVARQEANLLPFIRALEAIVAGSRDRALADAPNLSFDMAAELLFLIETLEKSQ
jgi:tetratricopeptide (TPR) repeat protein